MIDAAYLRERLEYDPLTGFFLWRDFEGMQPQHMQFVGRRAGTTQQAGYRSIEIDGKPHRAHRLAFIYIYGNQTQSFEIDHIDGDRDNNSISNLRIASRSQNVCNQRKSRRNTTGFKNVFAHKSGKWSVSIRTDGKLRYFGLYDCIEEAALVAEKERKRLHGEFARAA